MDMTILPFVFLLLSFHFANTLVCKKCSDGDCCSGNIQTTFTCPPHEDSCYEEYIHNTGSGPLMRRGCAPSDWCSIQKKNHGAALKGCRTCQGEKCNNHTIGICNTNELVCKKCSTDDCCWGNIQTTFSCPQFEDSCYEEYILNDGSEPLIRRGCAPSNWCSIQKGNHGAALKECRTCQGQECNNDPVGPCKTAPKPLVCKKCSGGSLCRLGDIKTTLRCPPYIRDSCYAEYITNGLSDPIIRRGCGTSDWCERQKRKRGPSLKECTTCKGDECNKNPIGSEPSAMECFQCFQNKINFLGTCSEGYCGLQTTSCSANQTMCFTAQWLEGYWDNINFRRGCTEDKNYCKHLRNSKYIVTECRMCNTSKCNYKHIGETG